MFFRRHRLHIYTVHTKDAEADAAPVFIREGFNWWGFLWGAFWPLYHRLWVASAINVGLMGLFMWLHHAEVISSVTFNILVFAQGIYIGLEGNEWVRAGLARRGYTMAGIVSGETLTVAERRFFEGVANGAAALS